MIEWWWLVSDRKEIHYTNWVRKWYKIEIEYQLIEFWRICVRVCMCVSMKERKRSADVEQKKNLIKMENECRPLTCANACLLKFKSIPMLIALLSRLRTPGFPKITSTAHHHHHHHIQKSQQRFFLNIYLYLQINQ